MGMCPVILLLHGSGSYLAGLCTCCCSSDIFELGASGCAVSVNCSICVASVPIVSPVTSTGNSIHA